MKKLSKFMFVVALGVALVASSANAYTHSVTLKMGMRSAQVMELQKALNVTPQTGYFGSITSAAVKAFQAANGLTADGVVGAMTGAKLAGGSSTGGSFPAGCTSTMGYSSTTGMKCDSTTGGTTSGPLSGTVGDITYTLTSGINNEEVGEGQEDVTVFGVELDTDDSDSDVSVTAVKVKFIRGTAAAATDFEDVADEVSVWLGSTKVGSADAEDFNDDNDESKSITLSNAIVRMNDQQDLYVKVSGASNLDTGDIGDTWTADITSVRFVDGQNAVVSEDPTVSARTFSFESFATANNAELVASLVDSEDATNESHIINVDATDDTDDVKLLAFELDADDSDSDIVVDEIPVFVTVTTATNVDALVSSFDLYHGTTKLDSQNVPSSAGTTEVITFEDLNLTIDAGETEEFWVKANFISVADAMAEGDGIKVELDSTRVALIDAEDESGEAITVTGTANGETSYVYDVGFNIELVSATETKTTTSDTSGTGDQGQFVIKYKVTAFDGDIYVDNTCVEDNDGSEVATATSYMITNNASNSTSCVMTATGSTTHGDYAATFLVREGETETFTLTVNATASADAFAQVSLEAIGWDNATGGDDNVFDFSLPGDFKTDPLFLNLF
jgi:hypothetical protein